jgi:hypothetical protein
MITDKAIAIETTVVEIDYIIAAEVEKAIVIEEVIEDVKTRHVGSTAKRLTGHLII